MYILFGGEKYYASGGAADYLYHSDDLDLLINLAERLCLYKYDDLCGVEIEWWHIIDINNPSYIVKKYGERYGDN